MADDLDRLARAHASGDVSRRRVLGLLLGASTTAVLGGTVGERILRSRNGNQALVATTRTAAKGTAPAPVAPLSAASGGDPACTLPNMRRPLNGPGDCPDKRITKQNYTPTFNGCGSAGLAGYLVPDDFDGYSFTPACDEHDRCYGTCNSNKDTCDQNFLRDMNQICDSHFLDYTSGHKDCRDNAYIYYDAVHLIGGGPYDDAQVEACDCCEEFVECVYCFCNDKYYASAVDCTGDCHASLSCFTGICVPADTQDCLQAWR
ncbi:MAG TPA: phospholipase A2 [Acidimicrobiales bacterium]|jgi:hypothetical protein|nr:phospholipase A2 [Acidimicrobiales bacterium]